MSERVTLRSRIPDTLPNFITEDHPIFVKFVEAYFEYLERQNGPVSFIRDALKNISPSESLDEFVKYFFEEVKDIPPNALADRRLLAEHIYELYQAKGTVKSFELFFRLMYNENIQIYFPKDDILRTSDGKWDRVVAMRATSVEGNIFDCIGNRVVQSDFLGNVNASANVENVIGRDNDQYDVYLSPNSIVGTLLHNVELKFGSVKFLPIVVPKLTIATRGSGYGNGDRLNSTEGTNLEVKVKTVLPGSITDVFILDGGTGHTVGERFIVESNTGTGADIRVNSVSTSGEVLTVKIVNGGQGYLEFPGIRLSDNDGKFLAAGTRIGSVGDFRILDPGYNHLTPPTVSIDTTIVITDPAGAFTNNEPIEILPDRLCTEQFYSFLNEDGTEFLMESSDPFVLDATIYDVDIQNNQAKVSGIIDQIRFTNEVSVDGFLSEDGSPLVLEQSSGNINRKTIRGTNSLATTRVLFCNPADIVTSLDIVYDGGTRYLNLDGRLSEFTKRLQDSRYYQEFSYVIKSGQSIDIYRNAVYSLLHPAGLALYGSVDIESKVTEIAKLVPEIAAVFIRILEEYVKKDITLAESALILESWASTRTKFITDYRFLEANKFTFGPRQEHIAGTKNTYFRQASFVIAESIQNGFQISDIKDWKLTDFYNYNSPTPADPYDPFYNTDYYSINRKRTKFTWPADISGVGESFALTENGEVLMTEYSENISL